MTIDELIKENIIDISVDVDKEVLTGSAMRQYLDEPMVSNGAKLLAYEVLKGSYGNYPYRKDNIYSAVMEYVNYICNKI